MVCLIKWPLSENSSNNSHKRQGSVLSLAQEKALLIVECLVESELLFWAVVVIEWEAVVCGQ